MEWTRAGLPAAGFVPFADLPTSAVQPGADTYVVIRPDAGLPVFLEENNGRVMSSRRHTKSPRVSQAAWVPQQRLFTSERLPSAQGASAALPRVWMSTAATALTLVAATTAAATYGTSATTLPYSSSHRTASAPASAPPREIRDDFVEQFGKLPFASLTSGRGLRHSCRACA